MTRAQERKHRWVGTAVGLAALIAAVLLARVILTSPPGAEFVQRFPGHAIAATGTPEGIPAWLSWQHALNAFFLVMIVRTGWLVRTVRKPSVHWTRNNRAPWKTRRTPKKISLDLWLHLTLDALWVLNGFVFVVLLFSTGHWKRIVPTSWDVIPNALSAALQYAAFEWPLEDGWVHYNALQLLSYFCVVFILAPAALISGLRMSGAWPADAVRANRLFPIELARAIHFPTMVAFVVFVILHVALVFSTGAVRNLEHMFAASDQGGWAGVVLFGVWLVVTVAAWLLARPIVLRPIAALSGKLSR